MVWRWRNCFREALRTLDWPHFFILQINSFSLVLGKGPVDLKCQNGLLGTPLIISRQFKWAARHCMEIKCSNTHSLGMHVPIWKKKSNAPARALFHFASFIYDHPVVDAEGVQKLKKKLLSIRDINAHYLLVLVMGGGPAATTDGQQVPSSSWRWRHPTEKNPSMKRVTFSNGSNGPLMRTMGLQGQHNALSGRRMTLLSLKEPLVGSN